LKKRLLLLIEDEAAQETHSPMNFFENRLLTRIFMYGFAVIIIGGSLVYSNYLARQLAKKEEISAKLWADAIGIVGNPGLDDVDFEQKCQTFLVDIIKDTSTLIPIVWTDDQGTFLDQLNMSLPSGPDEGSNTVRLEKAIRDMRSIKVEPGEGILQYVYFGDSFLLRQLKWFPYIQLTVAIVFVGIVFFGFSVAKRNEQNRVWVGLAKETAHQLGTPVSSLMAWIEFLKLKLGDTPSDRELVSEMERDIKRLEIIAERFSKIGSRPDLVPVDLREVLGHSANYIKKRMPKGGGISLKVKNRIPEGSEVRISPQLFEWVIENLLKNALDAIQGAEGKILIEAWAKGNKFYIDVSDTGKGIPKSNFTKVFEPGFTTKKRGWGLGLSLTRRIVENYHSGRIFVHHSELGKGTTFRIVLPG
jgi:hypothetical protein